MKRGIPFDVAFEMSEEMRTGFFIIFEEMEHNVKFNFDTYRFQELKK